MKVYNQWKSSVLEVQLDRFKYNLKDVEEIQESRLKPDRVLLNTFMCFDSVASSSRLKTLLYVHA